ncbi:hypothetical protein IE077_000675 [Cardiosporidium cionae]|uniref:Casein kinase substrate phosphoprotein PP28 domain-containing protein n=1 Tax=Cardiosporidium cionae TaxID=476202 RepID=A0ABQ7JE74_9APIC|nr:hypothetical protein IE077_000675 [Cardiosporidium cionae]|eukprot:KAF8822258.1 hypothetical protein IE077_000675 [Cardiosporidium cionae]
MSGRGMSSRGRGKSRRPRGGRGGRHVSSAEEVIARNSVVENAIGEELEEDSQSEGETKNNGKVSSEAEDSDEEPLKAGGAAAFIKTCNPNHSKPDSEKTGVPSLSRKERERLQAENYDRILDKLMAEGKTTQAKADLARLAEVRARREETALKRQMETAVNAKVQAEQKLAAQRGRK